MNNQQHLFWGKQPVPQSEKNVIKAGPLLISDKQIISNHFARLPENFQWSSFDVFDEKDLSELTDFLAENYISSEDQKFRLIYHKEFLQWALTPPGYKRKWHISIRDGNKLIAFISCIPATISSTDIHDLIPLVNFLCVHKEYRSKRLTPFLITETVRQVDLTNITRYHPAQFLYTVNTALPTKICNTNFFYRPLNIKKLMNSGFLTSELEISNIYELFPTLTIQNKDSVNWQPLTTSYLKQTHQHLQNHLNKYTLHIDFSEKEFLHWFWDRKHNFSDIISVGEKETINYLTNNTLKSPVRCWVNIVNKEIIGFFSYYVLNSENIKIAYVFYHTLNLTEAIQEVFTKNHDNVDIIAILNIANRESTIQDLNFYMGDKKSSLNYHFYNWETPPIHPNQINLNFF